MVNHPLTQYMFCSPGEGAVALVLARGPRIKELARTPVYLRSVAFRTRRFGSFEVFAPSIPIESAPSATTEAAAAAFEEAGIGPGDVDVAQIQDTESGAEVMHLAETGLCEHGEQEALIQSGATELGGRLPDQYRRRLPGLRRADRRVRAAAGARDRAPAAGRGRRPAGPQGMPGRLHPGLRRPRRQRLHCPHRLMYKAIGIWSWPRDEDRAEFDEHYEKVHYPLAEKLPGVRRITVLTGGENARAFGRCSAWPRCTGTTARRSTAPPRRRNGRRWRPMRSI